MWLVDNVSPKRRFVGFCICAPGFVDSWGEAYDVTNFANDPESKVSTLISQKAREAYTLEPEDGTSPAAYYLPEVKWAEVQSR